MSNLRCLRVSVPHPLRNVYADVSIRRFNEEKEKDENEPHFQLTRVIHSSKGHSHGKLTEIPTYCSAYRYHCRSRQRVVLAVDDISLVNYVVYG